MAKKKSSSWENQLAKTPPRSLSRAVVIAHKDGIEKALADGHSKRAVHAAMVATGEVSCSYSSFARALVTLGIGKKASTKSQSRKKFSHDPTNRDDLD